MEAERFTEEVAQLVDTGPGVVLVYEQQDDDNKWIQLAVTDRTDEAFQVSVTVGIPEGTTEDDLKETVQGIVDALAARWGGTFQCGIYADEDEDEDEGEDDEEGMEE
jgi:hypothetical protein